jgi:hypothetical protein
LDRGEQRDGEIVGVDVGRELSLGMKNLEPIADRGRPLFESGRDDAEKKAAISEFDAESTYEL